MIEENGTSNLALIRSLLVEAGIAGRGEAALSISALTGDGSSRKFWRVSCGDKSLCLAVAPPSKSDRDMAEARSARAIGLHLLQQGIRVPAQYGWNEEEGLILFEDLGDCKLHDHVLDRMGGGKDYEAIRALYRQVTGDLAVLQVRGAEGFDPNWCWDTPRYDRKLMLERESGYFLCAFYQDLLGMEEPSGLRDEFVALADRAALIPSDYFLHRDFQSRNIMLCDGVPWIIDFQGGRFGPLGYDLASLLIDPYVSLSEGLQEELLQCYLDALEGMVSVDRVAFQQDYLLLALQRNLQIIGAFSFLSKQRGKPFFRQFLHPALVSLNTILAADSFPADMAVLKRVVRAGLERVSRG